MRGWSQATLRVPGGALVVYLIALAVLVGGCGVPLFVKPEEQAVVDEHIFSNSRWYKPLTWILEDSGVRAASTKMERRLIVFERTLDEQNNYRFKVCAEPPAEAVQALESVSKFAAELEAQGVPLAASGTGDFSLQTAVQSTFRRTQGLQFYRDGAYQLCQAYLNDLICKKEYKKRLKGLENKAFELIYQEIKHDNFYPPAPSKPTKDKKEETVTKAVTETKTESVTKETKKQTAKK